MRIKRLGAFAAALTMSLGLVLQVGHTYPIGANGAGADDATNDVMSKVFALTVGNTRNLYARDAGTPGVLDLVSSSITTTPGFITFKAKVNGNLPRPNASAAGPQGFPPGVTSMTFYFNWATSQAQANSMTQRQNTQLVCGNTYAQQKLPAPAGSYAYRIEYNEHNDSGNVGGCRYATEGPFHPADGWNRAVLLSIDVNDVGNIAYTWSSALYDPIEGINWTQPGADHDRVECVSLNPTPFTCTAPNFLPTPGGVNHLVPATLNGANYYDSGVQRVGSAWPGGYGANEAVLTIPYGQRWDDPDDDNGKNDEEYVTTLMKPGDQITGFTTALGAAVSVNIPPGEPLCYGSTLYDITPALHDAEIVKKDECFSYSAGTTFIGDWVPGNPFVGAGSHPGVPNAFGTVCVNGSCNPSWGGYRPGDGTWPGPGSYLPGIGAPFCRYPAGLGAGGGAVPSGVTTRTLDDPLGGGTIKIGKVGTANPLVTQPYPAVPHDPDGGEPGVTVSAPTGSDARCFNTRVDSAGNWILTGTTTGFTAA